IGRLRGMFSFALYDHRERRLWVARDRIGVKPLYYVQHADEFAFGSELKSLLEYPGVSRAVDERSIDDFFTFGYVPSPRPVMSGSTPSFTASFPGTRDEDRECAKVAAERYGSRWHEVEVSEPSVELLDRMAWHFDEPFADPSAVPTFVLCEGARKQVTVCLSG